MLDVRQYKREHMTDIQAMYCFISIFEFLPHLAVVRLQMLAYMIVIFMLLFVILGISKRLGEVGSVLLAK